MTRETFFAALYIRLSREDGDKEESDSVGNQRKLLTDYVSRRDDLVLGEVYVDDGYTGTDFERPGFCRMLADLEAGKVNCVVVKDLSRFGRDYLEAGRYLERVFPELGVRFISVTDGIDSARQAYDLLLPIKNLFNEQYARDISRKIHATVEAKQRAGEFIGAFASYGYRKSAADRNRLVVDEYAASVVRRIFTLYLEGYGKQEIAKLLNGEGILCPAQYKRARGENYRNGNCAAKEAYWTYSTVNSILHREIYTGTMVQGTKCQRMGGLQRNVAKKDWVTVPGTHEAIIDRETWERTQELLKSQSRPPAGTHDRNLFAGLVRCGDCKRAMVRTQWRRADGTKASVLYCGTYKRSGKGFCSPHALPVEVLAGLLAEDLRAMIQSAGDLGTILAGESPSRLNWGAGEQLSRVRAELERARRLAKSLYEDYREGLITREEFLSYREGYRRQEELCARQAKALEAGQEKAAACVSAAAAQFVEQLESQGGAALDRAAVAELVSQVTVYEGNRLRIVYRCSPWKDAPLSAQRIPGTWGE